MRSLPTRKKVALGAMALAVLGLLTVSAIFLYRPALVVGVHGDQLGESISAELGPHSPHGSCQEAGDGSWKCAILVEPDPGSGGGDVPYRAAVNGSGCWSAHPVSTRPGRGNLSSCIGVFDLF